MSRVIVQSLNAITTSTALTFTDTFNRASGSLGSNWIVAIQNRLGAPNFVAIPACEIGVSSLDGLQCMKYSTINFAVGTVWYTYLVPLPPIGLLNRSQYSEWKVVRMQKIGGGNDVFAGITVLTTMPGIGVSEADGSCYILQFDTSTGKAVPIKRIKSAETGLTAGYNYTNGETWRLSATINTGDVTLRIFKNGVLQDTVVDNAANRVTTGLPGHAGTSLNNTSANYASEWRDFACGPA